MCTDTIIRTSIKENFHHMSSYEILSLDVNDSMNNLRQHTNSRLDDFAPYKKLSKKEYKHNSVDKHSASSQIIDEEYKGVRNQSTQMKRDSKVDK